MVKKESSPSPLCGDHCSRARRVSRLTALVDDYEIEALKRESEIVERNNRIAELEQRCAELEAENTREGEKLQESVASYKDLKRKYKAKKVAFSSLEENLDCLEREIRSLTDQIDKMDKKSRTPAAMSKGPSESSMWIQPTDDDVLFLPDTLKVRLPRTPLSTGLPAPLILPTSCNNVSQIFHKMSFPNKSAKSLLFAGRGRFFVFCQSECHGLYFAPHKKFDPSLETQWNRNTECQKILGTKVHVISSTEAKRCSYLGEFICLETTTVEYNALSKYKATQNAMLTETFRLNYLEEWNEMKNCYEEGEALVECMTLQYIGFDSELYNNIARSIPGQHSAAAGEKYSDGPHTGAKGNKKRLPEPEAEGTKSRKKQKGRS